MVDVLHTEVAPLIAGDGVKPTVMLRGVALAEQPVCVLVSVSMILPVPDWLNVTMILFVPCPVTVADVGVTVHAYVRLLDDAVV